jgi:hypothetical protein
VIIALAAFLAGTKLSRNGNLEVNAEVYNLYMGFMFVIMYVFVYSYVSLSEIKRLYEIHQYPNRGTYRSYIVYGIPLNYNLKRYVTTKLITKLITFVIRWY